MVDSNNATEYGTVGLASADCEMAACCPANDKESRHDNNKDGDNEAVWEPTGVHWRDFLHFAGPGWLVSIAYVDPGNYQSDILSAASARYRLLFAVWWTSILSIYVQVLCVRLAYHGNMNLAQAQAMVTTHYIGGKKRSWHRYLNWFLAEFSTVITDLPEVIGIGIACNLFFGWPYYIGVILSLFTTMSFLAMQRYGIRVLEWLIFAFVAIMGVALWIEVMHVGVNQRELFAGWIYGFVKVQRSDIFAIAGVLGSVVMPHNLYLHSSVCQSRRVRPQDSSLAVKYGSYEPIFPIVMSFFVNLAIVAIASESFSDATNGMLGTVGLTTFGSYLKHGSYLFGIALLAAGQSSAITTTFTGQYVMDGFLHIRLPMHWRAIVTRLIAITPCVLVSIFMPHQLNQLVNLVNATLSILLPFAFTPLVKYNCSPEIMGPTKASRGWERVLLYSFALSVWAINAITLSVNGGGFFGNWRHNMPASPRKTALVVVEVCCQLFYAWWNLDCVLAPVDTTATSCIGKTTSSIQDSPEHKLLLRNDNVKDDDFQATKSET